MNIPFVIICRRRKNNNFISNSCSILSVFFFSVSNRSLWWLDRRKWIKQNNIVLVYQWKEKKNLQGLFILVDDLLLVVGRSSNYLDFIVHSLFHFPLLLMQILVFFSRRPNEQTSDRWRGKRKNKKKKCYLDKNL
jgi:hypothetical protein